MQILYRYELTPPDGKPFAAAIVVGSDNVVKVLSTRRGGEMEPDDKLNAADLMRPEYRLHEWDVREIKSEQ